jgi:hypothetical protein
MNSVYHGQKERLGKETFGNQMRRKEVNFSIMAF